jgi:hypothetical protein
MLCVRIRVITFDGERFANPDDENKASTGGRQVSSAGPPGALGARRRARNGRHIRPAGAACVD